MLNCQKKEREKALLVDECWILDFVRPPPSGVTISRPGLSFLTFFKALAEKGNELGGFENLQRLQGDRK